MSEIRDRDEFVLTVNRLMICAMEDIDCGRNEAGPTTLDLVGRLERHDAALRAEVERLTRERDEARRDHEGACLLVAKMHHAATGSTDGPRIGVVEDVEALREELASLRRTLEHIGTGAGLACRMAMPNAEEMAANLNANIKAALDAALPITGYVVHYDNGKQRRVEIRQKEQGNGKP